MLKENVVFIGIGQGAGNIVRELELNDCQCFYVNTSLDDLGTIDTGYDKKYHISGTKGMAKDINFANTVIMSEDNDDKIVEAIYKKYANASIYFFVYTLAGGTGGGMGNQISKRMKERYPEKIINVITVLPNDEEDMIMQFNAIECLKGVLENHKQGYITNLQVLDNNKKDFNKKTSINKEYASMLDKVLSFQSSSTEGNLDEEELERLFTISGITTICELDSKDFLDELSNVDEVTIFAKNLKDVKTHGLILNNEQNNPTNRNLIREVFGMAIATHDTVWEEDLNIVISTGMSFDDSIINDLSNNYARLMKKKSEIESNVKKQREVTQEQTIDFSDTQLLGINPMKITSPERVSRRGSVGARGETRYRR